MVWRFIWRMGLSFGILYKICSRFFGWWLMKVGCNLIRLFFIRFWLGVVLDVVLLVMMFGLWWLLFDSIWVCWWKWFGCGKKLFVKVCIEFWLLFVIKWVWMSRVYWFYCRVRFVLVVWNWVWVIVIWFMWLVV